MGTHMGVFSKSYLTNSNMTWFRCFSKILASYCALDESSLCIGRVIKDVGAYSVSTKLVFQICIKVHWKYPIYQKRFKGDLILPRKLQVVFGKVRSRDSCQKPAIGMLFFIYTCLKACIC